MTAPLSWYLLLMAAVAMAFVIVPLWRNRGAVARSTLEQRRAKNRDVFRQREGELNADLQQGLVTEEEYAKLLAELQRAFLLDMQALDKQDAGKTWSGGRAAVLALALVVPVCSLLLYRSWGSGADLPLPGMVARLGAAQTEEEGLARYAELAEFLQERMERRPDDIQNGFALGTLYIGLGRYPDAVAVFESLLENLEPNLDRATVLGQLAKAQYAIDESVTPRVQEIVDETLRLNPNESVVMSILAEDALARRDFNAVIGYLRRQLSSVTPGTEQAEGVRQAIGIIEAYMQEQGLAAAPAGPTITLTIDVAPELKEQISDGMRLFIFVRSPAMPMPIIAENLAVPDFPFEITVDNSDSMMGMTLESVPQLVAGARLSRSGNATPQPGDLQTLSEPFTLSELDGPVELVIDEIAQ